MERRAARLLSGGALIALIGLVLGLSQAVPVRAAPVQAADLRLYKGATNPTPNVGDTVEFGVYLHNTGPSTATGVEVLDRLPAGLTFLSYHLVAGQGTYDPITGLWNVGTLINGRLVLLVVEARVASPNPSTNTAAISHSDQFDPNPSNNTASATVTPPRPPLPTSTDQCMHGGWQSFGVFRNQGDCVSFVATHGRNGPSG